MDIRYITIQPSIKVKIFDTQWTMQTCIAYVVQTDPHFNDSGNGIRAGARILDRMNGKEEGDFFVLDETDWKLLHEVMEKPARGWLPQGLQTEDGKPFEIPGRAFLGYIDAVKDAPTKEPAKEQAKEKTE